MAAEPTFVQEACLGRVKMRRGAQVRYLIKWQGYDQLKDVTCEPARNVHVGRREEPLLDQAAEAFKEDLAVLLKQYMDQPAAFAVSDDALDVDEKGTSLSSKAQVPKESKRSAKHDPKAKKKLKTTSAEGEYITSESYGQPYKTGPVGAKLKGAVYSVLERQFLVVEDRNVQRAPPLAGVFLRVTQARRNPGLGWTVMQNLSSPGSPPDTPPFNASVDRMSEHVGFGWFFHPLSGVSLAGSRHAHREAHGFLRFFEGDTVGIVVDTHSGAGYCVRNGRTVFRVVCATASSSPMVFAIHLCPTDEVTLCPMLGPLEAFVDDSVPLVPTAAVGGAVVPGNPCPPTAA